MTQVASSNLSGFLPVLPPPPKTAPPVMVAQPLEPNCIEPPKRNRVSRTHAEFLPVHLASISTQKLNKELAPPKAASIRKLVLVQNLLQEIHYAWARSNVQMQYDCQQEEQDSLEDSSSFFAQDFHDMMLDVQNDFNDQDMSCDDDEPRHPTPPDEMQLDVSDDEETFQNQQESIQMKINQVQRMQLELAQEMQKSSDKNKGKLPSPPLSPIAVPARRDSLLIQNLPQPPILPSHNTNIATSLECELEKVFDLSWSL